VAAVLATPPEAGQGAIHLPETCLPEEFFGEFVDHFYKIKREAKNELERTIAKLMLNSLYGKFGQKEKKYRIKIVSKDEGENIIKKYHYSYFSIINDNTVLIKYSSKLNDKLRKLYKDQEDEILNETYFKKERGILSAVQISCAIAAYARMSINIYKNMPNYIVYYSDTDSIVINKPLNENIIGKELGKWKLEAIIKKGLFVRPKLYAYYTKDDKLKRVASGVDANSLTFHDYEKISQGIPIKTEKVQLSVNWSKLEIESFKQDITLKLRND